MLCVDARTLRVISRSLQTGKRPIYNTAEAVLRGRGLRNAVPFHITAHHAMLAFFSRQLDWRACHPHRIASHRVALPRPTHPPTHTPPSLTAFAPVVSCAAVAATPPVMLAPPTRTCVRLKNESSLFSMTVRELTTQFRLLLTGTPLQASVSVCFPPPALP